MLIKNFFLIVFLLISFSKQNSGESSGSSSTETEEFNEYGVCETVTHPESELDCFSQTNSSYSCCYGELENEEEGNLNACIPISYDIKSISTGFSQIDYKGITYNSSITCNLVTTTCGAPHPIHKEECFMDSDDNYPCCYIGFNNESIKSCALGNYSYLEEYNITSLEMYGNQINCFSVYANLSYLLLVIFISILI